MASVIAMRVCTALGQTAAPPAPNPPPANPSPAGIEPIRPEDIADFPDVNLADLPKHPPSAGSIRSRAEERFPRLYEDAGRELGLSPREHKRLIALLIDQYVEQMRPNIPHDLSAEQFFKRMRAMDRRHRRQLTSLLGRQGIAALARYRKTIEPRYEVEDMRELLEERGLPLSESQRRRMVEEILSPDVFQYGRVFQDTEPVEAVRMEVRARVERNDQKLLAIARRILEPAQFAQYLPYQEMRRPQTIYFETPDFALEPDSD